MTTLATYQGYVSSLRRPDIRFEFEADTITVCVSYKIGFYTNHIEFKIPTEHAGKLQIQQLMTITIST